MKPKGYWTLERCKEDALKYPTRIGWKKAKDSGYPSAMARRWLKECCSHMIRPPVYNKYWTLPLCQKEALKYNTRIEWVKLDSGSYSAAVDNKWINLCCSHMQELKKSNGYWTLEKCKEEARLYTCSSDWSKNSSTAFAHAHKMGWIDECYAHMIPKQKKHNFWNLETCREDALRFSSRKEWENNSSSGYTIALKNFWMEECCQHMKISSGVSKPESDLFKSIKAIYPQTKKIRMRTKDFFKDKPYIKAFEIDIFIPELNKGIEFNGNYWHSVEGLSRNKKELGWLLEDIANYHQLKRDFFKSRGIDYIEIWESDWSENSQLCINSCLKFLGVTS